MWYFLQEVEEKHYYSANFCLIFLYRFYMQCGVNFSSDSIPNGIGFGGRTHHFNLFISSNFDHGHTFTGATFNSPCLSKNSQICAEVIECWGIVAKGGQQEKQEGLKGSVLERFKEDRNMLNLVGLANSSKWLTARFKGKKKWPDLIVLIFFFHVKQGDSKLEWFWMCKL